VKITDNTDSTNKNIKNGNKMTEAKDAIGWSVSFLIRVIRVIRGDS
jgi:hypothetical protein